MMHSYNLSEALEKWKTEQFHDSRDVIFEIIDSEIYTDKDDNGTNIIPIEIEIPDKYYRSYQVTKLAKASILLNKPITVKGMEREAE